MTYIASNIKVTCDRELGEIRCTMIDGQVWFGLNCIARFFGFSADAAWDILADPDILSLVERANVDVYATIRVETLGGSIDIPAVSLGGVGILCAASDRIDSDEVYSRIKELIQPILSSDAPETPKTSEVKVEVDSKVGADENVERVGEALRRFLTEAV